MSTEEANQRIAATIAGKTYTCKCGREVVVNEGVNVTVHENMPDDFHIECPKCFGDIWVVNVKFPTKPRPN